MIRTYTDGTEEIIPTHCPYCSPDTGGNHAMSCPNYRAVKYVPSPTIRYIQTAKIDEYQLF